MLLILRKDNGACRKSTMSINQNLKTIKLNRNNGFEVVGTDLSPMALFLLKKKAQGLLEGVFVSDALISEIDSFASRNNTANSENGELHTACPSCLKAHAIAKARELGLDQLSIEYIDKILEGEIGHQGYYLDEDNLIKL